MAELFQYDVVVNGIPTTLRLTEKDAKSRGFTAAHKRAAVEAEPATAEPVKPADKPVTAPKK